MTYLPLSIVCRLLENRIRVHYCGFQVKDGNRGVKRNQAEQAKKGNPVSSAPWCPLLHAVLPPKCCIKFLSLFPQLIEYGLGFVILNKPLFPQVNFIHGIYHDSQ